MNKMQERDKFNTSCREHGVEITIDHVTRHIAWKRDDCPVCRIIRLEQQLAEAREEVERFKHMAEQNSTEMCEWMEKANKARQEAAREIIALMGGWSLQNSTLITCRGIVARHFGLEG